MSEQPRRCLPMSPDERFKRALDDFCEAMDDFLDPDGTTASDALLSAWFKFRNVRAEAAIEALRDLVRSHPQLGVKV